MRPIADDNRRIVFCDVVKKRKKKMPKELYRLVSALVLILLSTATAFAFGGGGGPAVAAPNPAVSAEIQDLTIPLRLEGSKKVQRIPLFSEQDAETAVAVVNGEPITLKDFAMELASMHSNMTDAEAKGKRDFGQTLDRLIAVKLIKQEALNIGFDRIPAVRKQIENFALKTMIQQLLSGQIKDIAADEKELEELYRQMAIEAKLLTYRFFDQADAASLLKEVRAGGDFKVLADKMVAAAKAEGGEEAEFARLNDLLPQIAQAVYPMEKGKVSEIFKADKGYLLFRLEDRRVYEDPETRQLAVKRLLEQEARKKQIAYLESLQDKYATIDEKAEEALNFAGIMEKNPKAKGTEVFARLSGDQRPLAKVVNGKETVLVTVAEIAKELESSMYHGMDRIIDAKQMDNQKETLITSKLIAITGRMEAQNQGIDTSEAFLGKLEDFEDRLLFDTFMSKAVVPGITVREEAVRAYYDENLENFSSPLMLKMKSLVFTNQASARDALKKLQAGSDFKWVSANSTHLAAADNKDILGLGDTLLSITALPEALHRQVEEARQGDHFLYEGPADLFYLLQVDNAYPPVAKPYDEVRQEIGRILYARAINEALADWVGKLKEAYETKNYLVQDQP